MGSQSFCAAETLLQSIPDSIMYPHRASSASRMIYKHRACVSMYLNQCVLVTVLLGSSAKDFSSLSKRLTNIALHKECWDFVCG